MDRQNPEACPGVARDSTDAIDAVSTEALRLIPEHMRAAARRYIEHGQGDDDGFVLAVARNDLRGAFRLAARMHDWVRFFHAYVPSSAWGSPKAVKEWTEMGGLHGLRAAAGLIGEGSS
jgi:hypothetical protein